MSLRCGNPSHQFFRPIIFSLDPWHIYGGGGLGDRRKPFGSESLRAIFDHPRAQVLVICKKVSVISGGRIKINPKRGGGVR